MSVIGMIRQGMGDDQETVLFHGHLHIVVLVKAIVSAVFHNPRLWIGEVVLVFVPRPRLRWLGMRPRGLRLSAGLSLPAPASWLRTRPVRPHSVPRRGLQDGLGLG